MASRAATSAPVAPAADRRDRSRVLYLGGLGRSGSTLLERMVGQLPGVCALGEVVHLWERGLLHDEKCGCGEPFSRCPFWTQVGALAFGGWDTLDARQVLALKHRVDRNRHIPRLLGGRGPRAALPSADLTAYLDLYERVYAAALAVSGATLLVDASKHASLAFVLRRSALIDLRVVQMVRDSPAVAYSWSRVVRRPESAGEQDVMPRYSAARVAALWTAYNALFDLLRLTGCPVRLVRYEDVMAAPASLVAQVAAYGGLGPAGASAPFIGADRVTLLRSHTVAGNPMRFTSGEITLRRDEAWRTGLSARRQRLVRGLTAAMRLRLGYPATGASPVPAAEPAPLPVPHPTVTVVVPTRDRPELLRTALRSIAEQDYPGTITTLVVYDQSDPDPDLADCSDHRPVVLLTNRRKPGLAGGRNTGILAAAGDLVAFCDDDDSWHPGKISAQVRALAAAPGTVLVATGIRVLYGDHAVDRSLPDGRFTFTDLLRSRVAELHPSTFLFDRAALRDRVGLVSEDIPGSYGEDYEFLLRAARVAPIVNVPSVEVDVLWHQRSYFDSRWETVAAGLTWLLSRYPEFDDVPRGKARVAGQIAFAHASMGDRRQAWRWTSRTLRLSPTEPRALLALAVAAGVVRPQQVLTALHRRGKGI